MDLKKIIEQDFEHEMKSRDPEWNQFTNGVHDSFIKKGFVMAANKYIEMIQHDHTMAKDIINSLQDIIETRNKQILQLKEKLEEFERE